MCKPHVVSCHCCFTQPFYRRGEFQGPPPFVRSFIHSSIHPLIVQTSSLNVPGALLALQESQAAVLRDRAGPWAPPRLPPEAHLVSGGRQERRRWGHTRLQPGWRRRCGRGGRQFPSRCCRTRRRSGCAGDGRGWHPGRREGGLAAGPPVPGSPRTATGVRVPLSPARCRHGETQVLRGLTCPHSLLLASSASSEDSTSWECRVGVLV